MSEAKETAKKSVDLQTHRYSLVGLTREWLSVLQKGDEAKTMGPSELVKRALQDIVSGAVSREDVAKAYAKQQTSAEDEKKTETAEKPAKDEKGKKE